MKPTPISVAHPTSVYYWCTGQDDNLGDVVLRRRLLGELHDSSCGTARNLRIYVGSASESFVRGLSIPTEATVYTTKSSWYISLLKQTVARRVPTLVFNPGEVQRNINTILAYVLLIIPSVIIRVRGGAVLRTGVAVDHRGTGAVAYVATAVVRFTSILASEATWRDSGSHNEFKRGRLVPDWAIEVPSYSTAGGKRDVIAVTFRSDRPKAFDAQVIGRIRRLAELRQATVTVFCQVRRDRNSMERLSKTEGWDFVDWHPAVCHQDQEKLIRNLFSKSIFVCSNRIHALIMGLTEGAQAICLSSEPEIKVRTHLEYFGLGIVLDADDTSDLESWESEVCVYHAQENALVKASEDVSDLALRVRNSINAGGRFQSFKSTLTRRT